jgi:hypothetical protein
MRKNHKIITVFAAASAVAVVGGSLLAHAQADPLTPPSFVETDDPRPSGELEAAAFSASELETFATVEAELRAMELVSGFTAIGSPDGSILGYVKTEDLMSRIRVPIGERSPDQPLNLYDEKGQKIGIWSPSTKGFTIETSETGD